VVAVTAAVWLFELSLLGWWGVALLQVNFPNGDPCKSCRDSIPAIVPVINDRRVILSATF
jgi:hypothetical protein